MNDKSRPNTVIERTYRASPKELWELWTTKDGFESWWGPEGFCAKVHTIEARVGGKLFYDMVAATAEMVEAMKQMDRPASHETRGHFAEFRPYARLKLIHVIDFLPGVGGGAMGTVDDEGGFRVMVGTRRIPRRSPCSRSTPGRHTALRHDRRFTRDDRGDEANGPSNFPRGAREVHRDQAT